MKNAKWFIIGVFFTCIWLSFPAKAYRFSQFVRLDEDTIEVTANRLHVRTGPGTDYQSIGTIAKGTQLDVLGALDQWYVVHLPDNQVGVVHSAYTTQLIQEDIMQTMVESVKEDEATIFVEMINEERAKYNLPPYEMDDALMQAAYLKAEDMEKNQYLSHTSPTYGSPFQMLKDLGILYKRAGENIVANQSLAIAHSQIMSSASHKANVLNTAYNKIGIGIVKSEQYGNIVVQLFIEI